MNTNAVIEYITRWMEDYISSAGQRGFVIGISGGVDSAVCSTLAAMTGRPTLCVTLPIHQPESHVKRAAEHVAFLKSRYSNVDAADVDLTAAYESFIASFTTLSDAPSPLSSPRLPSDAAYSDAPFSSPRLPSPSGESSSSSIEAGEAKRQMTNANTRARLRMTALYYFAGINDFLVVGTGNKVEDFGIGFFTKYGDGGVDISPIGDLTKTEVYQLAAHMDIPRSVITAPPTDGLFGDDRTDEEQIGATYPELEWAMRQVDAGADPSAFNGRRREVYDIFVRRNRANRHKMMLPPFPALPARLR